MGILQELKEIVETFKWQRANKKYHSKRKLYEKQNPDNITKLTELVKKELGLKEMRKGLVMFHPDQSPNAPGKCQARFKEYCDLDVFVYGKDKLKLMKFIVKKLKITKIYAYYFDDEDKWARHELKEFNVQNFWRYQLFELVNNHKIFYIGPGHSDTLWVEGSTVESLVS